MGQTLLRIAVVPVLLVAASEVALADEIDGNWCQADGRTMTIDQRTIVTPGGHQIQGDYATHFFRYVVPSDEPKAGSEIFMQLRNDIIYLWVDAQTADPATAEVWRRCEPIAGLPMPRLPLG